MARRQAIDIALDARSKGGATSLLAVGPLPEGVTDLLHIVAEGEWRAPGTEHAYRRHGAEEIRAASAAFLGVVLFDRKADPYRVLGLAPGASAEEVRDHKRLLLKWLHPDRNPSPEARAMLRRVLEAAEAIDEGRASTTGAAPTPPPITVPRRGKASSRSKARTRTYPARQAAWRVIDAATRAAKIGLAAAVVTLVTLLAWRYFMEEPIGASLSRYSRLVLGVIAW